MTAMTYSERLKDPRWQKMRLRILERDAFTCLDCGATDKTLHVHHSYYVKNRDVWDYPLFSLKTLCCDCHEVANQTSDALGGTSMQSPLEDALELALGGSGADSDRDALWDLCAEIGKYRAATGLSIENALGVIIWNTVFLRDAEEKAKPHAK
jgi:hypothetical protein